MQYLDILAGWNTTHPIIPFKLEDSTEQLLLFTNATLRTTYDMLGKVHILIRSVFMAVIFHHEPPQIFLESD